MKKSMLAILLASFMSAQLAFASVYTEDSKSTEVSTSANQPQAYRNSFLIQGNAGFALQSYNYEYKALLRDHSETLHADYSGVGLILGLKLGLNVRSLFAVYGLLGLTETSGEWDLKSSGYSKTVDDENTFYRIQLGIGGSVYPFRSFDNILHTLYFGVNIAYCILEHSDDDEYDGDYGYGYDYAHVDKLGLMYRFEVGQVWPIGSGRWNIGYQVFADIDLVIDGDSVDGDDKEEITSWTIGVAFTIMRK